MNDELTAIDAEYRDKLYNDPAFAAKCQLAKNVLTDVERDGRLVPDYAGYMLIATLDKAAHIQPEYKNLVAAQLHEAKHLASAALDDARHGYDGPLAVSAVMMPTAYLERLQELISSVESRLVG